MNKHEFKVGGLVRINRTLDLSQAPSTPSRTCYVLVEPTYATFDRNWTIPQWNVRDLASRKEMVFAEATIKGWVNEGLAYYNNPNEYSTGVR